MGWVKKKFFERFKNFELIPCTIKFFFNVLTLKRKYHVLVIEKKIFCQFLFSPNFHFHHNKDVLEITVRFSFKSFGI